MAENRKRFRNKKRDDGRHGGAPSTPVIIARREDSRSNVVQPRILLKKEPECHTASGSSGSNNEIPTSIKTIIINRSDARGSSDRCNYTASGTSPATAASGGTVCAALATASYTTAGNKDKLNGTTSSSGAAAAGGDSLVPLRMTRPSSLFNGNARKLFHKSNTDFTVIGVLGAQSVGKSTLLNLLAMERDSNYDYYQHLFAPDADECIFATAPHRAKQQTPANPSKQGARSRGEFLQFFITRERYILLDAVPMVAGKETDQLQELQTMSTMMQLLSVCHVLILALDELSLEQLRLLNAALRLRPRAPLKGYIDGYLPQLMFVRTRAQRAHFETTWRESFDKQLELLFQGTGLNIHRGRGEARMINSFVMPEVHSNAATAHHVNLFELIRQFRERVFTIIRQPMSQCNDFTELLWFDLLTETARKCHASSQHFDKTLAEIRQRHVETRGKCRSDFNWRSES